jgi:hypothetical protein
MIDRITFNPMIPAGVDKSFHRFMRAIVAPASAAKVLSLSN